MSKKAPLEINGVRILKHGVKINGQYTPVGFSHCELIDHRFAVTIYGRRFADLPKELGQIINNTEIQSDYFENDRVRFYEGTPEYIALCAHMGVTPKQTDQDALTVAR